MRRADVHDSNFSPLISSFSIKFTRFLFLVSKMNSFALISFFTLQTSNNILHYFDYIIMVIFAGGSEMWNTKMITLAVLLPLLAIVLLVCGILLMYYRKQKNRRTSQTIKTPRRALMLIESGIEPSMFALSSLMSVPGGTTSYSHEFRATAAGDTTLKVF